MATGYTAAIQSGEVTDFRTFALRCARAFGACILQRDDPTGDLPKLREVDGHYETRRQEAIAELTRLERMSLGEAEAESRREYAEAVKRYEKTVKDNAAEQARYDAMLDKVVAWQPPSEEHRALKQFMIEQLNESKRFDNFEPTKPCLIPASKWLEDRRAAARKDVIYYSEQAGKELARVEDANRWIQQLYESLPA